MIIAGLAEMIIPRSGERQAVRFLIGIVIIFALIEPIGSRISGGMMSPFWQVDAMFSSGGTYIERGQQFAENAFSTLIKGDHRRLESGLAAIISLVDGVESAKVNMIGGGSSDDVAVVVTLIAEAEPENQIRFAVEKRVADLIQGLYPELNDIKFIWEYEDAVTSTSIDR